MPFVENAKIIAKGIKKEMELQRLMIIFLKYESKNKTLTFFYVALMQIKVEKQTFFIKVHKSQHIPLQNHQIAMLLENHKGQSHL